MLLQEVPTLYFFVEILAKNNPDYTSEDLLALYTFTGGVDLIALDELEKKAVVAEIKRNKNNIKMDKLIQKGLSIQKELIGYSVEYQGLDLKDM